LKHVIDVLASLVAVALAKVSMVNIVSLLTLIWWTLRIYETPTVQRWLGRGNGHDRDRWRSRTCAYPAV
jgi:hypothetical protein